MMNPSSSAATRSTGMEFLARSMPWVISLLFHLGLFLVMMFLVYAMIESEKPVEIQPRAVFLPEENHFLSSSLAPSESLQSGMSRFPGSVNTRSFRHSVSSRQDTLSLISPEKKDMAHLLSAQSNREPLNPATSAGKSDFFSVPARARGGATAGNIVYVIDCSGSMMDTFDRVRDEVLTSLTRLSDKQHYHVILFSQGLPRENPPRRLVRATREHRNVTARFLRNAQPERQTDVIPALRRAFAVLRNAKQPHSTIFLLTDGVFPDNQAVLEELRTLNTAKRVSISTILYGARPREAETLLRTVAKEHQGQYRFVPHE
ncbi:MAG: VWA domain-containing protein [Phycisphaerae bacterium]|nr:VWA domain-containing protein [Phycisphaerae bacterium]